MLYYVQKGEDAMAVSKRPSRYVPRDDLKCADIDGLLRGSIDMHVHVAPEPGVERRFDTLGTLRNVAAAGMRGFVAKSHCRPTMPEVLMANREVEGCTAFGSVTIGYASTGGLEHAPEVIREQAELGCKVVWFPTFDAEYCRKGLNREGGISILEPSGKLRREAEEILDIAAGYGLVVCKGHMSFEETLALFSSAAARGMEKLVCTHPFTDSWGLYGMDQIKRIADTGAYTEIVFNDLMPRLGSIDPADYVDLVRDLGADRMIMSTDLARCMDPSPAEGMRFFIGIMLQFGCSEAEVRTMVKDVPEKLLSLDTPWGRAC